VVITLLRGIPKLATKGWKNKRIDAINRKIKNFKGPKAQIAPEYAQEATDIYSSAAKTKKEYKARGKK
jgi:hypothetical protein